MRGKFQEEYRQLKAFVKDYRDTLNNDLAKIDLIINARLYRQGQEKSVIIHHLITAGTADEHVLKSLRGKKDVQDELLNSLKAKYNR